MEEPAAVTFDLVVATLGRSDELGRLLNSLEQQTHRSFRAIVVDQNADDRVDAVLAEHSALETLHLRAAPGLALARNVALARLEGDVVAFPDDDARYAPDLLATVASRFDEQPNLAALLGRTVDDAGRSSDNWPREAMCVTLDNIWHCSNSNSVFLRSRLVRRVGGFDESLGLGAGTPWASGEETEYLVRALRLGARIEFDPSLTVDHTDRPLTPELGYRDGASTGYILAKHRFSKRVVARMAIRPVGGALLALARRDLGRVRFYGRALRGRANGYRGGLRAR